jgi:hypothetical protein
MGKSKCRLAPSPRTTASARRSFTGRARPAVRRDKGLYPLAWAVGCDVVSQDRKRLEDLPRSAGAFDPNAERALDRRNDFDSIEAVELESLVSANDRLVIGKLIRIDTTHVALAKDELLKPKP